MSRVEFPTTPIDGRVRHAHHFDGDHGCTDHFHVQGHREGCQHAHDGTGHLISIDAEVGIVRDDDGKVVGLRG